MFTRQGIVEVKASEDDEERLLECVLDVDDDMLDVSFGDDENEETGVVICQPTNLAKVKTTLHEASFEINEADIVYVPTQMTQVPSDSLDELQDFFNMLDEEEDVQRYFHTADLTEA